MELRAMHEPRFEAPEEAVANRRLADLFRELDRRSIAYCVLRGIDELTRVARAQEVDLLVSTEDLDAFIAVVGGSGFAEWPSWGHAPHRFFMTYDVADDSWIKLDVVTELRYGKPYRNLPVGMAAHCLRARQRWGPTWIPAAGDELLTTVLHCVLDKGGFRHAHRQRLQRLWSIVATDLHLRVRLERTAKLHLGEDVVAVIAEALEHDAWERLSGLRERWSRRLLRRAPWSSVTNALRNRWLRRARRLLFVMHRHPGTATVLLAPDGGGKSTLSSALAADPFLRARVVYMGSNVQGGGLRLPSSRWLDRQLARARTRSGNPVVRLARKGKLTVLRALNTVNHLIEDWVRHSIGRYQRLCGRFVVFDRYFYDAHLSPRAGSLRVRLRRWILERTCAPPDRVLLLDAPGDVLFARKGEHSPEALEQQRQTLLGLAANIPNFTVVDTSRGADETRRRVVWLIWNDFVLRRRLPALEPTSEPSVVPAASARP